MTRPTLRIPVADDCPVLRELYRARFGSLGAEVTLAADGTEALLAAATSPFDLVITDHEMPRTEGLTVVRTPRAQGFAGAVAVVSGALTPALTADYRRAGATAILAKPCSLRALQALVEHAPAARCAA